MQITTTRFGVLEMEADDLLRFPRGLMGLEACREWVLLADGQNDALAWLQSASRPEIAVAVVSPRRFVPEYQVSVPKGDISRLQLNQMRDAQVLVIVGRHEHGITLNLKAPLVMNLERGLGVQVINSGNQPLRYPLPGHQVPLKKSA